MKQVEFERWRDFYERFPFDPTHIYYRPAALISESMAGGKFDEKLDWLRRPLVEDSTDVDLRTMKAFGFGPGDR